AERRLAHCGGLAPLSLYRRRVGTRRRLCEVRCEEHLAHRGESKRQLVGVRRGGQNVAVNRPLTPPGGFHNFFGPQAGRYREYRPRYPEALFHYLAVAGGGTRVAWDCATGNGQAAVRLAERFAHVIATDPSDEMIAQAIPHPRVTYSVAKYESGLPDRSTNLVTGGVLAAWCYARCTVDSAVDEIVDLFYTVTLGPFWPKERRLVDEGYRTIALPLDEMAPPPF